MRVLQTELYDVFRNGKLFRSFPARQSALAFIAAARELCPTERWKLVLTHVEDEEDDDV